MRAAHRAVDSLGVTYPTEAFDDPALRALREGLLHFLGLTERVLDQTRRRVFHDESVPAAEKVVSIFEPQTDVIKKEHRETVYGHKVFLTAGASGLVFDCTIQRGNPADSTLAVTLVDRAAKVLGAVPRQTAFDGGFSSRDNVFQLKQRGVADVAFSKAPGLKITDMVKTAGYTGTCDASEPASKASSRSSNAASVGTGAAGAPSRPSARTCGLRPRRQSPGLGPTRAELTPRCSPAVWGPPRLG